MLLNANPTIKVNEKTHEKEREYSKELVLANLRNSYLRKNKRRKYQNMIKILPLMGLIRFQVFYKLVQYEFQDIRV